MTSTAALHFEELNGQLAEYQTASKEKKSKHLEEKCGICLEKYLPHDLLIFLSCDHSFHKHCFTSWEPQTCPLDQTPLGRPFNLTGEQGVWISYLLGNSLLFPSNMRHFGIALYTQQKILNAQFNKYVEKYAQDNPDKILECERNPELFERTITLKTMFFQDLLNASDGVLTRENVPKQVQFFIDQCQKAIKLGCIIPKECDLTNLRSKVNTPLWRPSAGKPLKTLAKHYTGISIQMDDAAEKRATFYLQQLVSAVVNSPEFPQIAKKFDIDFLTKHFKKIRAIPNEKERITYLSKLSPTVFDRIDRLTQDEEPSSLFIKQDIARIKKYREPIALLKVMVVAISVGLLAITLLDLSFLK